MRRSYIKRLKEPIGGYHEKKRKYNELDTVGCNPNECILAAASAECASERNGMFLKATIMKNISIYDNKEKRL